MEISIGNQLLTVLNSIFLGLFSCFIYQMFLLIKLPLVNEYSDNFIEKMKKKSFKMVGNPLQKEKKRKKFKIVIQSLFDFAFFVVLTPIYAIFFYETSDGIVRWYVFFFSAIGFLIFELTIGKFTRRIIEYLGFYLEIFLSLIINKTKKVLKSIYKRKPSKKKVKEEKKQVLVTYGK